jgi:transcriptional regulator with XRE-family HTH domain
MGRRRTSDSDRAFRTEVARRFRAAMQKRGLNQTQAARELSITKQALSQYLREKVTPQGDILARACAKWGITLRYRDTEFTRGAFGSAEARAPAEVLQLDLFREPQVFENQHFVLTVARSHKSTLQVTFRMKHATLTPRTRSLRKTS